MNCLLYKKGPGKTKTDKTPDKYTYVVTVLMFEQEDFSGSSICFATALKLNNKQRINKNEFG